MTAKDYLKGVAIYQRRIDTAKRAIAKMEDNMTYLKGISYERDKVQTSPKDSMPDMVIKKIEKETSLVAAIRKYNGIICETVDKINSLENADYISILYLRYIEGRSMEEISVDISLSYYRTCHLHGDALQAFENKYSDYLANQQLIARFFD